MAVYVSGRSELIKARVLEILATFTKEELKQFSDFLCSPLFNKRQVIRDLLESYKKYHPSFDDKSFTKERIFRKLFPGKEYSDEMFRNLNSQLLKLSEDFLSYINFSADKHSVNTHLLKELLKRNLYPQFEKNFREAEELLANSSARDQDFFNRSYELYLFKDIYNSFRNSFSKQDIQKGERDLLISFAIKILEIQNYILYECRLLGIDRSLYLSDRFTENLMKDLPKDVTDLPQVKIHYNAFMLEKTDDSRYFAELRRLVTQHGELLEKEKRYNKYIDLIEHLKRSKSMNNPETVKEVFELRKEIIEKGLYTENFMTNMFFLNMVKSGSRLGEFEWVQGFIENYNSLIAEDYRQSTYRLALAVVHFEMKEYDKALSHLARVKYEDNYYNLEVRNLTARIYFEKDETDLLNDYLNSYRIYVSKNRALGKREIESHTHFISIVAKLMRIKESGKSYKLDELIPGEKKKEFINKAWVVEKMKELEER